MVLVLVGEFLQLQNFSIHLSSSADNQSLIGDYLVNFCRIYITISHDYKVLYNSIQWYPPNETDYSFHILEY